MYAVVNQYIGIYELLIAYRDYVPPRYEGEEPIDNVLQLASYCLVVGVGADVELEA